MLVTTKQLADVLGVSDRTVQIWGKDRGCPKAGHGKWNLKEVLPWWAENVFTSADDSEELAAAKLEYWQAKARGETVKADLAEEKVIPVDEIKKAWVWRVSEMSSGLRAIPMRLAPLIAGKNEREIRSVLDSEIWKILDQYSRTGKFTPAAAKKKKHW